MRYFQKTFPLKTKPRKNLTSTSAVFLVATFLVPNFRANSNIKFEYVEKVFYYEKFENPFKVCHENVCKENVTNYYFEKGKSYQIYVKLLRVLQDSSSRYDYAVPPFRFYAEDSVEEYSNDDINYTNPTHVFAYYVIYDENMKIKYFLKVDDLKQNMEIVPKDKVLKELNIYSTFWFVFSRGDIVKKYYVPK